MKAPQGARAFYDGLASLYHLVYDDWESAIERQAQAIVAMLSRVGLEGKLRVLDVACGIGTQTIGMASRGFDVTGVDISPRAVARARRELRRRRLRARVMAGDMGRLPEELAGCFDVVTCMDNPLAHLHEDGELAAAFGSMREALRPGGTLLLGSRDYDALLAQRPSQGAVRRFFAAHRETVVVPLWTWDADGRPFYTNELIIARRGPAWWTTRSVTTRMRAWTRDEIGTAARGAGFEEARWLFPEETGSFQPVLVAARPRA